MTVDNGLTLRSLIRTVVQEMMLDKQWPTLGPPLLRQAMVDTYDPSTNTVSIYLGGSTTLLLDCPCLSDYVLKLNDSVWVLQNGSDIIVLGRTGGGAVWTTYTPTLSSDVNPAPTLGTGGTIFSRWILRGKSLSFTGEINFGTSPGQPGGQFLISTPFGAVNNGNQDYIGTCYGTKFTGTPNLLVGVAVVPFAGTTMGLRVPNTTQIGDWNTLANGVFPLPFASGDTLRWSINYETV